MTEKTAKPDYEEIYEKLYASLTPVQKQRVTASVGRPPKYDVKLCELLIACFSKGFTIEQFVTTVGICKSTFHEWTHSHREFSDAYKKAKSMAYGFYNDIQLGVLNGDSISQAQFLVMESTIKRRFAGLGSESGYSLPELSKQKTPTDQINYILQAIEDQNITIESANLLINSIKTAHEHVKLEELESRLEALQASGAPKN